MRYLFFCFLAVIATLPMYGQNNAGFNLNDSFEICDSTGRVLCKDEVRCLDKYGFPSDKYFQMYKRDLRTPLRYSFVICGALFLVSRDGVPKYSGVLGEIVPNQTSLFFFSAAVVSGVASFIVPSIQKSFMNKELDKVNSAIGLNIADAGIQLKFSF